MTDDRSRERIRRAVEEAGRAEESEQSRQRNAGLAILVLAALVVGLLLIIVMGGIPGFPG